MPFAAINLLVDQQATVTMPAGGSAYFSRGRRVVDLSDIQYVKLNYRLTMGANGTNAACAVEYSPDVEVTYFPLIPAGQSATSTTAVNASGAWTVVDPAAQLSTYIIIRLTIAGTPSATFTIDFAQMMYR